MLILCAFPDARPPPPAVDPDGQWLELAGALASCLRGLSPQASALAIEGRLSIAV